jgi:hypothetical protein
MKNGKPTMKDRVMKMWNSECGIEKTDQKKMGNGIIPEFPRQERKDKQGGGLTGGSRGTDCNVTGSG